MEQHGIQIRSKHEYNQECSNYPNIFSFATSELSQDAIFAWIMSWAKPEYANTHFVLNDVGCKFVRMLLGKSDDFEIQYIDVKQQWKNIDLLVQINNNVLLIIEDKIETKEHDNQLERYKQFIQGEYGDGDMQIYCTYIKTGNESNGALEEIRNKGYNTIERYSILECIGNHCSCHPILQDYYDYLNSIEHKTVAFRYNHIEKWDWYAWQGFYRELEKYLCGAQWGYVPNPSGGFLGMRWHWGETDEVEIFLQFEQKKLCFKICADEVENGSEIRNKYHRILMEKSLNHSEIKRPRRFGTGTWMTIAYVDADDLLGDGIINMSNIVSKLKEYEIIIDEVVEEVNKQRLDC